MCLSLDFISLFRYMRIPQQVDWVAVATKTGYNSASTARCRWAQIRRELLAIESGVPVLKSLSKPRVKKENGEKQVGSGTNHSPLGVTKSVPMKGRSKSIGAKGNEGGVKGRKVRIGKGKKVKDESDNEEDEEQYMEKFDDASDEIDIDGQGH